MIYETIIISTDPQSHPHIAPFGVREQEGMVVIAPFRPSSTLDNLLSRRVATMNAVDDVRIFAGALTDHRSWPVHQAEKIDGFFMDDALAHRELELVRVEEDAVRPLLYFRVVHEVNHRAFRGFNRAQAAVIELSVLVSRLHMLPMEKIETEMAYLSIAIEKTAGVRERQAWDWLVERIGNYKANLSGDNLA
ncbi:MAG TPA: DUF447 domain-containing protein [Methylophilaceae bacterium]|nr:DUF447 domain-containing protein [Methylophilaceae bacterium]